MKTLWRTLLSQVVVLILLASGYRRFGTIRFYAVPSLYGSTLLMLIEFEYWIASWSLYYVASRYIFCFGPRSLCALCHVIFLCRSDFFVCDGSLAFASLPFYSAANFRGALDASRRFSLPEILNQTGTL